MGKILDALRPPRGTVNPDPRILSRPSVQASYTSDPSTFPIASPWSSSDLQRIVFEDIFGSDIPVNTRSAAMKIPAIARARNLLVSTVCRFPMVALRGDEQLLDEAQPTWMYRSDDGSSVQQRIAWTVDDLIFYGWSCWWRKNGADGFPIAVGRLQQGEWTVNADNKVEVLGQVMGDRDVILIPGLHEGILTYGSDAIADAKRLYQIVGRRLLNPSPQIDLHQVDGDPMTEAEIETLITRWAAARQGKNSGVGYSNQMIQINELGAGDSQLMIEARNAASLDLARMVGVAAGRIDATTPTASLNYETTTGRNQEFVDFDLALYMTPISARLSLDDVMPRGTRCGFELADFIAQSPSMTGPGLQD